MRPSPPVEGGKDRRDAACTGRVTPVAFFQPAAAALHSPMLCLTPRYSSSPVVPPHGCPRHPPCLEMLRRRRVQYSYGGARAVEHTPNRSTLQACAGQWVSALAALPPSSLSWLQALVSGWMVKLGACSTHTHATYHQPPMQYAPTDASSHRQGCGLVAGCVALVALIIVRRCGVGPAAATGVHSDTAVDAAARLLDARRTWSCAGSVRAWVHALRRGGCTATARRRTPAGVVEHSGCRLPLQRTTAAFAAGVAVRAATPLLGTSTPAELALR